MGIVYAKTSLLTPMKHLFRLKSGQNRRFNLWKREPGGCVCKCPEWILSVFMQFYEGRHEFWTIVLATFDRSDRFWAIFDPICGYIGHYWAISGPNWKHFGVILGWFRTIFGWIRVILGSLRDRFASFWHHLGVVFWMSFWPHFEAFWALFGHFLGRKSQKCLKKIYAKLSKNMPFFRLWNTCFCFKKKRSKSTFQPWKCAASGCVWKCPECMSVFMHFDEGLDDFWVVFRSFFTFFGRF